MLHQLLVMVAIMLGWVSFLVVIPSIISSICKWRNRMKDVEERLSVLETALVIEQICADLPDLKVDPPPAFGTVINQAEPVDHEVSTRSMYTRMLWNSKSSALNALGWLFAAHFNCMSAQDWAKRRPWVEGLVELMQTAARDYRLYISLGNSTYEIVERRKFAKTMTQVHSRIDDRKKVEESLAQAQATLAKLSISGDTSSPDPVTPC